ncbi:hypothetical protein CL653_00075 [bacterium]|nr:hypothetical protein [bacterium]|tara:strand:- start:697 stop:1371 length:675 start_codon:yes stop_codon:yes gene_type:complete
MFNAYGDNNHSTALFEAGAVGFNFGQVIRFKSGILSPGAYLNNRVLQSRPKEWDILLGRMIDLLDQMEGTYDVVASVATGAIIHGGALVRMLDDVPHMTVKKEEKANHGLKGLIDGDSSVLPGAKVVLVEDMSSTFESALKAIEILEMNDAEVVHTLAISTWGFPIFHNNIADRDVSVLCQGEELVRHAVDTGAINAGYADLLSNWLDKPEDEGWINADWTMPE